jgi:hypothetical protein
MPLTPEDIAYLRMAAARDGYNADDALKTFTHESSLDPTRWGGKGGKYFGLFQAGAPERAQYGVDVEHPSARNQIDAFGRFLHGRGFRPGMGLKDMYSTVLAGSPGHYNRSDGAGTVAQHVARMQGDAVPLLKNGTSSGLSISGPADLAALSFAPTETSNALLKNAQDPIGELLAQGGAPKKPAGNLTSLVQSLLAEPPQKQADSTDDAFMRQMMDFHNAQHMRAVQGLL